MSDHEVEDSKPVSKRPHGEDADVTESQTVIQETTNPFRSDEPKKKKKKKERNEDGGGAESIIPATQNGPDGQPLIISKRQKKRMQQAKVHETRKDEDNVRTIAYLTKWHANRAEWKFEKLRQINIQKNILNATLIPDEHFEVALEYLATTKGAARTHIIESVEKSIEQFETRITDENREEIINSTGYKRAREVLQTMN